MPHQSNGNMMERKRIPLPKTIIFGLLLSYLAAGGMALSAIWYANYVDRQSNQQWCTLIVGVDDAYQEAPATNRSGKRVAESIHKLRNDFGC